MTGGPISMVHILQWRAFHHPEQLAFRFLPDGDLEEELLTYKELDSKARSIAALLQSAVLPGERAVLLFQPGLDFIVALFGCFYAKVIAVPAYPPHPARVQVGLPLIRRIVADTEATALVLSSSLYESISKNNLADGELRRIKLIVTNEHDHVFEPGQWQQLDITGDDIAFLQYTSGSTASPKGVIIRHKNLIHNLGLIERSFGVRKEDHAIFWLPPYHDMGLIGGILQPVYSGASFTLMPQLMFLQRPIRWLQAISRYKAAISGGPNFAFQYCVKKIKPEQILSLDLRSWRVAFNGAELIYHKTLNQFAEYFAPCGFRKEAFATCYGLAEATLFVVGGVTGRQPVVKSFFINGSRHNITTKTGETAENVQTLVGCGMVNSEQKIMIVNSETHEQCQPGEIGEIWVNGSSIASGYWNKPAETEFAFGATLSNDKHRKFLRTGDLGFIDNEELFVTGRIKNLVISEGKNHYSQDIERSVEAAHPAINSSECAAFSVQKEEHEDLIIVVELAHNLNVKKEEICMAIRESVSLNHGLKVHTIKLTKKGAIPRTTSGKIQHFLCKQYYLEGIFKETEVI